MIIFIINNIFCKIIKQASLKEATSKFPLKLLGHCKNFMGHWVRPEKEMLWNNSYSRLPIIRVIWNFCHLFHFTSIPLPQPYYYFMKFTRKKRKSQANHKKYFDTTLLWLLPNIVFILQYNPLFILPFAIWHTRVLYSNFPYISRCWYNLK